MHWYTLFSVEQLIKEKQKLLGPVNTALFLVSLIHKEIIPSFPRDTIQRILPEGGRAQEYFQLTFINV